MVGLKFAMAVFFGWFLSRKLGDFEGETSAQRKARVAAIEDWTNDIYQPAPGRYRPNVREKPSAFALPKTSRYSRADSMLPSLASSSSGLPPYGYSKSHTASSLGPNRRFSQSGFSQSDPFMSPASRPTTPSPSSPGRERSSIGHSLYDSSNGGHGTLAAAAAQPAAYCPFETPLGLIPQPPADFEPFGFPLMRQFMLVTAYSESIEGLRTTLDSLATTDYPNSHKLILVIADGMVKGAGSTLPTPDICLGMMKELLVPAHEVEPHSYVAIADGYKKHNMAKVYAGFYDYDDDTVERSKQQRVPMLLIAKVGTPLEAKDAKPGNRGKRDSQVMLMAFLQKVLYDERMTTFEYELFKAVWAISGVHPSFYEGVLAVDADTKVFPDSLTRSTCPLDLSGTREVTSSC
jgi:chitin synthase